MGLMYGCDSSFRHTYSSPSAASHFCRAVSHKLKPPVACIFLVNSVYVCLQQAILQWYFSAHDKQQCHEGLLNPTENLIGLMCMHD